MSKNGRIKKLVLTTVICLCLVFPSQVLYANVQKGITTVALNDTTNQGDPPVSFMDISHIYEDTSYDFLRWFSSDGKYSLEYDSFGNKIEGVNVKEDVLTFSNKTKPINISSINGLLGRDYKNALRTISKFKIDAKKAIIVDDTNNKQQLVYISVDSSTKTFLEFYIGYKSKKIECIRLVCCDTKDGHTAIINKLTADMRKLLIDSSFSPSSGDLRDTGLRNYRYIFTDGEGENVYGKCYLMAVGLACSEDYDEDLSPDDPANVKERRLMYELNFYKDSSWLVKG